jgi:hypothetical protein
MKDSSQIPSSEHSEWADRSDRSVPQVDVNAPDNEIEEQAQVDRLLKHGFVVDEAVKLIFFRDQLYSNGEMRQRIANNHHMQFMRWLYEQGELRES